jgi:transposase
MARKSKVELYAAIRRDCRAGMSKRAVMRKYGVGHPTVQNALESAWPRPRKTNSATWSSTGTAPNCCSMF